jgi:Family of unknown function (DUF6278)
VRNRWRRWIPGTRHGLPRGVVVYGVPGRPDPGQLAELLGGCDRLRAFARAHGFELDGGPQDLRLLDQAIDEAINQATSELGGPPQTGAALTEAGLFLGSVIVATVAGARWRLWPNGHPVVRLASGRDLDVAAMASDRMSKGTPRLADVYADAAGPSR